MLGKIKVVNLNKIQAPESRKNKNSDLKVMGQVRPKKTLTDKISINKSVKNINNHRLPEISEVEKNECDSLNDLLIDVLKEQGVTVQTPSGNIKIDTRALESSEAQDLIFSISHLRNLKYGFPKSYLIYYKQGTFYHRK